MHQSPRRVTDIDRSDLGAGAPLARLEARAAIDSLLDHFAPGEIRLLANFEHEWMPLPYMLGPVRIDIEALPARA